jgi:hypothetical protein
MSPKSTLIVLLLVVAAVLVVLAECIPPAATRLLGLAVVIVGVAVAISVTW